MKINTTISNKKEEDAIIKKEDLETDELLETYIRNTVKKSCLDIILSEKRGNASELLDALDCIDFCKYIPLVSYNNETLKKLLAEELYFLYIAKAKVPINIERFYSIKIKL